MWNYKHAIIHLSLVQLRLLCIGGKTGMVNVFLLGHNQKKYGYGLWMLFEMGEDYTSQSGSEFDWYNPHQYNYWYITDLPPKINVMNKKEKKLTLWFSGKSRIIYIIDI